jgi:hypothetical protein
MQDLIDLSTITDADWTAGAAALDVLEEKIFSKIRNLTTEERSEIFKMGPKSEAFCRHALITARAKVDKLDPDTVEALPVAEGDLAGYDKLRTFLTRLTPMFEKGSDSLMAAGSDVMVFATFVYGLLKALGASNAGLDNLRKQLGARFAKSPKKKETPSGSGGDTRSGWRFYAGKSKTAQRFGSIARRGAK